MTTRSIPSRYPFLSEHARHTRIALSVVPGAKQTQIAGLHGDRLRVRLAAKPVEGAANEALRSWIAGELDVSKQSVQLLRGATARLKLVEVDLPMDVIARWLDEQGFAADAPDTHS
jgi:uncharacterized protein YggU (UPF0235/DUF167 family)